MTTQPVIEQTTQTTTSLSASSASGDRFGKDWKPKWFRRLGRKTAREQSSERSQDPWRVRAVFWLARTINPPVRPQQDFHINLTELRQLPDATLGRELAHFLDSHHFQPPQTGDWLQKTHDIWHVLTGLSPSTEDEVILQAFVRAQIFRPSSAIVVLLGLLMGELRWKSMQRSLHLGRVARNISQWDIEADWATPLAEVREKLGIHRQGIDRQVKGFHGH